ncbi:uncharacterized protein ISCGN_006504, partial [Ixodes scapularis]
QAFAEKCAATATQKHQITQEKNLLTLRRQKETRRYKNNSSFVTNLSSRLLSQREIDVLARGHNYNLTTTRPPLAHMAAAIEDGIMHMVPSVREGIRLKAISALSKLPRRQPYNISKEEHTALRKLREDSTIVILPADKGNTTVVLDRVAYEEKTQKLLDCSAYKKLKRNPTLVIQRNLNSMLATIFKNYPESKNLYLRLICRNGFAPGFYGLPKIHKPDVPLRPIVDFTTSPLRALSDYLHRVISPLAGNTPTNVRNSSDFVERISQIRVDNDECL